MSRVAAERVEDEDSRAMVNRVDAAAIGSFGKVRALRPRLRTCKISITVPGTFTLLTGARADVDVRDAGGPCIPLLRSGPGCQPKVACVKFCKKGHEAPRNAV